MPSESDQEEGDTGFVRNIEIVKDEDGKSVTRVVVEFYDGNCPRLTFADIWKRTPVQINASNAALTTNSEGK